MKTNCKSNPGTRGSALVISLLVSAIIGISLASYLTLIVHQSKSVSRAQLWNEALPVAEAGVEEALTQLHYASTNNLSMNGWTLGADGMYHMNRTLSKDNGFYGVAIQPATIPVIWSTGYVAVPWMGSQAYVGQLVKVTAVNVTSFGQGITAKGKISFSGGAYLDGYAITNGVYDTNGLANAVALTDASGSGVIYLSGGHIAGYASTGTNGTVTTSGSGSVGDTSWIASNSGVQTNHFSNDANYQFNDITAPSLGSYSSGFTALGTTNIAGLPGMTTSYVVPTISSSSSTKPLIIQGDVTIYCTQTGNNVVSVSGSGFIYITPGSKLTLYTAGNVTVSGGGIVNGTGLAANFTLYGLPTCTSITYSGGANFVGVADAPEANFTFSGSEKAIGAFVVNTATISGGGGVHWDPAASGSPGYVVNTWNEMPLH